LARRPFQRNYNERIYGIMINNETVVTASLFGMTAGIFTQSTIAILIGAVTVGIVQPFFRVYWQKKLSSKKIKRKYKKRKRIR